MSHRRNSHANVFGRLWTKAFAARRRKTVRTHRPRVRPQLECLEGRVVPAVIDVTTLSDGTGPGTLRSAIAQANTNDSNGDTTNTINLDVAGTYNIGQLGLGALAIFNNVTSTQSGLSLTIQNNSGGNVAISGNNATRVFDINPNNVAGTNLGTVVLKGFTIENGIASPGDGAGGSGGGIRDQGNVNLTLTNMVVTHDNATADGGGLVMFNMTQGSWTLTVNNSIISDDHAGDAGGGIDTDGAGTVFINNSRITGNTDINQGAGVYIDVAAGSSAPDGANMTMTNTLVSNNSALAFSITASGGGISNAGTGAMVIDHSTIENNFTGGMGGGFSDENNNGTLVVTNSLFLNNTASMSGGGIQEGGPSTTISNSEFKGNFSGGNGAALFANGKTLTVQSSTFANNTAAGNGGGIEVETTGTGSAGSTITNTTITGNGAVNNAGANGGGLDAVTIGRLALLNDTINANFANKGGGVFWDGSGAFSVQNTIIAANVAGSGGTGPDANNPAGTFTDNGGNLIGVSGAGSGNTGFTAGTTQTGTVASPLNPMVAGLTNNGGPLAGAPGAQITVETEALLPGSPAIGKGITTNAPTTDERGAPRVNTNDVGAFQFANATLQVSISAGATLSQGATEPVTVTVTNTSGNALPADNSTVTVTASSGLNIGGTQTFTLGALAGGQSQTFSLNATGVTLGAQTLTASVTSPDTDPLTVSNSVTVNVTQAPPTPPPPPTPPTAPIGAVTVFAFGFGPTGIDLFEIDSAGDIFAVPFMSGGGPIFINTMLELPLAGVVNNSLLALVSGANGQLFLIDIIDPFAPGVLGVVLAALHL